MSVFRDIWHQLDAKSDNKRQQLLKLTATFRTGLMEGFDELLDAIEYDDLQQDETWKEDLQEVLEHICHYPPADLPGQDWLQALGRAALDRFRDGCRLIRPDKTRVADARKELIKLARVAEGCCGSTDFTPVVSFWDEHGNPDNWFNLADADRADADRANADRAAADRRALEACWGAIHELETCRLRWYEAPFPVVLPKKFGSSSRGRVVIARIGVPAEGEELPKGRQSGEKLRMAPWSVLPLDETTFNELDAVVAMMETYTERLGELALSCSGIVIDLRPAEEQPLPVLKVQQRSLTLSILLAAWAASRGQELRPVICSAAVDDGHIDPVSGWEHKCPAADEWAGSRGQEHLLLIQPEFGDGATSIAEFNRLQERLQNLEILKLPGMMKDLAKEDIAQQVLTDGFDACRDCRVEDTFIPRLRLPDDHARDLNKDWPIGSVPASPPRPETEPASASNLEPAFDPLAEEGLDQDRERAYLPRDWFAYARLIDALDINRLDATSVAGVRLLEGQPGDKSPAIHREVIQLQMPYGNDPHVAAAYHIRRLLRRLSGISQQGNGRERLTEYPIPLPLPLAPQIGDDRLPPWNAMASCQSRAECVRLLVRRIRRGLEALPWVEELRPTDEELARIDSSIGNILLSTRLSKLCLIVYGESSESHQSEDDEAAIRVLRELASPRYCRALQDSDTLDRPTYIFLPSDLPHGQALAQRWDSAT